MDQCEDLILSAIMKKANVTYRPAPDNWAELGGLELSNENEIVDDGKTFFYQKQ